MQAQLKTAQANTRPKFLIELAKPTQKKNCFKKNPSLQKNKKHKRTTDRKSTRQITQTDDIKMVVTHDRQERQRTTAPTKNWRFSG